MVEEIQIYLVNANYPQFCSRIGMPRSVLNFDQETKINKYTDYNVIDSRQQNTNKTLAFVLYVNFFGFLNGINSNTVCIYKVCEAILINLNKPTRNHPAILKTTIIKYIFKKLV